MVDHAKRDSVLVCRAILVEAKKMFNKAQLSIDHELTTNNLMEAGFLCDCNSVAVPAT